MRAENPPSVAFQRPASMSSVALIVLTYNEEVNLPYCLKSVQGLTKQTFVVDSGSRDTTCEIARRYGALVAEHHFENQAQQFNWALDHLPIAADWVLRLDADEYLLPELLDEIRSMLPSVPQTVTGLFFLNGAWFSRVVGFDMVATTQLGCCGCSVAARDVRNRARSMSIS